METTNRNIPALRFPEFESKIENRKFGTISLWASGGTPSKENDDYWNGDIPWISASSMRGLKYSDSDLKITSLGLKNGSKSAPKGTLLILVRGSMLFNKIPIGIATKDLAFNQDVKSITLNEQSIPDYILQWFISKEPLLLGMVTGTGIGAGKLDLSQLKALDIFLPTIAEQQKIASFLTAVDNKIQQLQKKKELLEQYKKAVMQQIFTQQLRFKDDEGNEFPEWEGKALGDICSIEKGKQLNVENMVTGGKYYALNGGIQPSGFTNEWNTNENTITISEGGNSCGYVNYNIKRFWSGGHCYSLLNIIPSILDKYLFHFLKFNQNQIMRLRVGSGLPNIQKRSLKEFKIIIPNIEEQKIISNFLDSVEYKIDFIKTQTTQTQNFKKGLLQQLFV